MQAGLGLACAHPTTTTTTGAPRVPEGAAAAVPAYLKLDTDVALAHPRLVRIARDGEIRFEHDGRPVAESSGRGVSVLARLVDEDAYGSPVRPRVLCEADHHRVAVMFDRDDLATVTTERVVLRPVPGSGSQADAPGLTLPPGTALRVDGARDAEVVHVLYERPGIRAQGFARGTDVGIGYAPGDAASTPAVGAAKLDAPASFRAMPGGPVFAELDPRASIEPMITRTLGREQAGEVLVATTMGGVEIVGWVAAPKLAQGAWSSPRSTFAGAIEDRGEGPRVTLRAGTILRGGALRDAVGVVTADAAFRCTDACASDHPKVVATACTALVELWAD